MDNSTKRLLGTLSRGRDVLSGIKLDIIRTRDEFVAAMQKMGVSREKAILAHVKDIRRITRDIEKVAEEYNRILAESEKMLK